MDQTTGRARFDCSDRHVVRVSDAVEDQVGNLASSLPDVVSIDVAVLAAAASDRSPVVVEFEVSRRDDSNFYFWAYEGAVVAPEEKDMVGSLLSMAGRVSWARRIMGSVDPSFTRSADMVLLLAALLSVRSHSKDVRKFFSRCLFGASRYSDQDF